MFGSSGGIGSGAGKPGAQGKASGGKSAAVANREINKSDSVSTDAAQLVQAFDDPIEIFEISEKKIEETLSKVKGGELEKTFMVYPYPG